MPWDPPYYSGTDSGLRGVCLEKCSAEKAGLMCSEHLPTNWAAVLSLGAHVASACPAATPGPEAALWACPCSLSPGFCGFPVDPVSISPACLYPWCQR